MSEKEKKHGWPSNIVEKLLSRSLLGILENHIDDDQAYGMAHWGLLQFLSGDVQRIKRSIYLTETNPDIRCADLIDDQVTIIRVCGEDDVFDWFIIVQVGQENHLFSIGTPGNMGTLEPRIQHYSINELSVLSHEEVVCFLDKDQLIEVMNLSAKPEKFNIVFSGFMEEEQVILTKKSLTLIPT